MRLALLAAFLAAGAGALLVLRRRFLAVTVTGVSMEPTLRPGDRVLVRRVPLHRVRRGQLVVIRPPAGLPHPQDSPPWMVKRAVALPGDTVPIEVPALDDGSGVVPPGRFVVLGDNAGRSYDSRRAGCFRSDALLGVVVRTLR
ncbi:S26 family signal peptidase [Dactylosporangium sp. NPDC049742]|uniref:S26 family signal peptidase n=1 Tax=Dactylosporangium sp. NPDC049742 TaxID=3154737 RepID=UPI0034389366